MAAGIYRSSNQLAGAFPSAEDFDTFYAQHRQLLSQDAWRQYYSPTFLAQATSTRFYRLPDLQDLPDSSAPLAQPRQNGLGHSTKLPRWAHSVVRTHRRQPTLPAAAMTRIALSTLQQTIARLRKDHPSVQPYSETQACFWLTHMGIDAPGPFAAEAWSPDHFGVRVAQGAVDVWAWEAHYSRKLWDAIEARTAPLAPDLDGTTRKSAVEWCGWPDGGVGVQAWWRGWGPEVGSEEEVAFLAAVAVAETGGGEVGDLDGAIRSHVLLGVLRAAFGTGRERRVGDLERWVGEAGRIGEGEAGRWVREVLRVVEPYVQKGGVWPAAAAEERSELLRRVLVENGQLFARWKLSPLSKQFDFELRPRE